MSRGPSAHLTWAELACKDGTAYPQEWRASRAVTLAQVFEAIRAACGQQPIAVVSAFRTPEHNRRIGGARHSQHVQGRALDLKPPKGMTVAQFHARILALVPALPALRGVGRYRSFVHVDVRPADRLARWTGAGVKDAAA